MFNRVKLISFFNEQFGFSRNHSRAAKKSVVSSKNEAVDPYLNDLPVHKLPMKSPKETNVYGWGTGEHGALGHYIQKKKKMTSRTDPRFKVFKKPFRMLFGEQHKVRDIAAGYGFSAFSVKNNSKFKVYGTGINTDSQIGFHESRPSHPMVMLLSPVPINLGIKDPKKTKVIGLSAGRAHLVVVTDLEGVFTLGNNAYGQCGRTIINDENYLGSRIVHQIPTLEGENVQSVECGQDHTLFLTESGKVYSCGWGADGQTGLGHYKVEPHPKRVLGDIKTEKIVKISSKSDCVLALNVTFNPYLEEVVRESMDGSKVEEHWCITLMSVRGSLQQLASVPLDNLVTSDQQLLITSASNKGEVFGWGNSEYSQIFNEGEPHQQINRPIVIKKCQGFGRIVDVAAGGSFCLMLNECGEVFSWGHGILGHGPNSMHAWNPKIIPSILFGKTDFQPDVMVNSIYCGLHYCGAINNYGHIYTWGKNKRGCLGLGVIENQYFPLRVMINTAGRKLSFGVDHSLALCNSF